MTIQNTVATLALLFVFALPNTTQAQKFAYIDTDYILLHLPDFAAANRSLILTQLIGRQRLNLNLMLQIGWRWRTEQREFF